MKMNILMMCFLILFITNIDIALASEEPALTFTDSNMCYDTGSLMFYIESNGAMISVDKINITAEHKSTGKTFQVNGIFNLDDYDVGYASDIDYINTGERVRFESNEALFNNSGEYLIRMRYYSTYPPYYKEKTFTTKVCPGLVFSCDLVDLFIDKCYTKNNTFYAYFHGNGLKKQSNLINAKALDLYKEISYQIQGTTNSWSSISTTLDGLYEPPKNLKIRELGNSEYEITMPVENDNQIKNIVMVIEKCNYPGKYTNFRAYKKCTGECTSDLECNDDNICTEDKCLNGNCIYEKIENCCITDESCDDSLVCTEDKCIDNRCVHEEIKCLASDDPNVIGECVEPVGCQYSTKKKVLNIDIYYSIAIILILIIGGLYFYRDKILKFIRKKK